MEAAGVPLDRMICVGGGETVDLVTDDGRGAGVRVTAYPSQHSCVWALKGGDGSSSGEMAPADQVCLGDLGLTWQEQQARMVEMMGYLSTELGPANSEHLARSMTGHSNRGRRRPRLRHRHPRRQHLLPGHLGPLVRGVAPTAGRRGHPRRRRPGQHRR